ncbi:hypothetical protein ACFSCX_06165 [Bacillus salitolerans]|uniref:Uncharacterized protein n=1 Tax=Bacillus salitolerans TaxID=1437434 RepID=A0ABW4LML0_9BACI
MKGTITVESKSLETFHQYYQKRLEKGMYQILLPMVGWGVDDRFFYYQETESGYEIEGLLYTCDSKQAKGLIAQAQEELNEIQVDYRLHPDRALDLLS